MELEDEVAVPVESMDSVCPQQLVTMSAKEMQKRFGQQALQLRGALFQHTSKIGEAARFLNANEYCYVTTENGRKVLYRKGQLHESVALCHQKCLGDECCGASSERLLCPGHRRDA